MNSTAISGLIARSVLVLGIGAVAAGAQTPASGGVSWFASRDELETDRATARALAASPAYGPRTRAHAAERLAAIERRLVDGDFRVGDSFIVGVTGSVVRTDTVTVMDGRRATIPQFGDFPLDGVLRAELEERVQEFVARTARGAFVSVRPLVRVAVFGTVATPGYFAVPLETRLDQLLTFAGGPSAEADPASFRVMRGNQAVLDNKQVADAVAAGVPIAALGMREGDQFLVDSRQPPWDRATTLQILSLFAAPLLTFFVLRR